MPTQTYFSATEKLAILPTWVIDRIKEQMTLGPAAWQVITDAVDQAEVPQVLPCEVKLPPSTVIGKGVPVSTLMLAIAQRKGYPVHARAFTEQNCTTCNGEGAVGNILDTVPCPVCAAAQPAEIDDLADLATWKRRAIKAESKLRTYDPHILDLSQREMEALLADPRPTELVLMKCVLCDQLQADLTERDQRIDLLEQQVQLADHWLEFASFNSVGEPVEHTQEMRDEFRKQMIAAVFPDIESRPEERGTPETEPCSGCGTPGWTGACDKCVPY